MVLSRLTKITGPGVATDTNWVGNNADFTGITTSATSFNIGVTTIHSNLIEAHNIKSTGIITATGAHFSGNVSIAGTLTYEDVTNIDSVGIITAPALDVDDFLDVGSSIKLGNAGVITATSFVGSGAALTGIDATAIKDSGGNVKIQAQASGAIHTGVSTFQDIDVDGHTNLDNVSVAGVSTFSNQAYFPHNVNFLGQNSGRNIVFRHGNTILDFSDSAKITMGNDGDLEIYHSPSGSVINDVGTGNLQLLGSAVYIGYSGGNGIEVVQNGEVELRFNNNPKLNTTNTGVTVTGTVVATGADINGDIDVDGHTNLDNVSIAGVVTATSFVGSGANLTSLPAQATIANNADNRVITGGSGVNLNGEANLTFDGSVLTSTGVNVTGNVVATGADINGNLDVDGTAELDHTNITGIATFMDAINVADIIRHGGDGDTTIRFPANDTITFGTAGGERIRITSDGKIGMKTSSPQKDLHVYNSSVSTVRIETGDSRGQAWDILSTNGAQNNTGTLSFRNEAGNSFLDLSSNEGAHRTIIANGTGSALVVVDKSGNANIAGVCTATAFKGDIVPATYHGGRRNMFINGEFMIDQRGDRNPMANQNNGANGLGYGGPDHVQFVSNLGAFEAKQANEASSPRSQAGAVYSYELDCTSASGPSTSNYTFLKFKWSGIESARLLYGTSNARPVTISFWVQCNKTGNFTATLRNETANKLISQVVTISSSNTWEYKTITFVGDTAAQIAVTSGDRWNLELWLDGGSNYTGGTVRTGWSGMNNADRGAGSTLNICSSTSNYFRISLFQVEMGPYATPFEFRTYGEYLHDCEYFFQKPVSSRGSNQPFAVHIWGHKVADTYALRVQTMLRPTEMRQNPTDYYHDNNPSGLTAQRFQTQGADYEYTYNVGMNIGSNRKEFAGGTKYPYGVNGMNAGESGILWAYDFESYAEY